MIDKDLKASNKIAFLELQKDYLLKQQSPSSVSSEEYSFYRNKLQKLAYDWDISYINFFILNEKDNSIN